MDMGKEIFWYEIDQVFKERLIFNGAKLTPEECRQRVEEIIWLRDEVRKLWESKSGR